MIGSFLKTGIRRMSQTSSEGVHLYEITSFLQKFAPVSLAESWDNTGLLIEPTTKKPVKNILLTNDLTEDVISEALDLNIHLIISYHPPIFNPIKKITTNTWKERIIATCLENKIAVYSPHTSWDSVDGGVNDWLASAFDVELKQPLMQTQDKNSGPGRYCKLKTGVQLSEAIKNVKKLIGINHLNLAIAKGATLNSIISDVAICAGSGATVLGNTKADLYLTGEMSHHSLLEAIHNGTSVILCNHSNSERGFLKEFMAKMSKQFEPFVNVFVSKTDKDPLEVV